MTVAEEAGSNATTRLTIPAIQKYLAVTPLLLFLSRLARSPRASLSAGAAIAQGGGFLVSYLLALIVGLDARGYLAVLTSIATMAAPLCTGGVAQATPYLLNSQQKSPTQIISMASIPFLAGISILLLLLGLFVPSVWPLSGSDIVATVWLTAITSSLLLADTTAIGLNRPPRAIWARVAPPIAGAIALCCTIPSAATDKLSVYLFTYLLTLTLFAMAPILQMVTVRQLSISHGFHLLRHYKTYLLRSASIDWLSVATITFDKLVLVQFISLKELGFYAIAQTVARSVSIVQTSSSSVTYSELTKVSINQVTALAQRRARQSLAAAAALVVPVAIVGTAALSFLGGTPGMSALLILILALESLLSSYSWALSQVFLATGNPTPVLTRQLGGAAVIVLLTPVLVPEFGLGGLIATLYCAALARLTLTLVQLRRTSSLHGR